MDRQVLGSSFDRNATAYAAARPTYPDDAVRWLAGEKPVDVLDLGAGTGALSGSLVDVGHQVSAVEPSAAMLRELRRLVPGATAVQTTAESLPFVACAFDLVVVATAFHWLDASLTLPEIARVLRPGGQLSLVWNTRIDDTGWPCRLGNLLRGVQPVGLSGDWGNESVHEVEASSLFGALECAEFRFTQCLGRADLADLVSSRSYVTRLDERSRARLLDRVHALFDEVAESGTVELPYRSQCWRTTLIDDSS